MADDVRRWSVTYTKHLKQKRKVYQDGFLEIQSSTHKVKLYDDCDKLLDCKIVKLDDDVRSGETLTFGAYLVDIGDPHGESKPIPNLILKRRDNTLADRDGIPHSKASKRSSGIGKASSINMSPSQKIIKEFKRREVKKYCSSPSCPDTAKADSTEWQVLYTTQLTQKAKKFHDGILRVAISGMRGKQYSFFQAMLYDETRRLLDSRFLRSEEIVKVGESLRFDGHIVDIVELGDHTPLKDTNVEGRNCYMQNTMQSKIHKWDVLYTTQVTQKAKKFHDGVLKLASCGSQGRQEATLLAEDGTILSHRYLKLCEDISSGSLFNMPNYLVEVGEPRKHSEGRFCSSYWECPERASTLENETPKIRSFDVDNIKLCKRIPATRPLSDGGLLKRASSLQETESKATNPVADKVISTTISKNKPLRDAHSILSILKKPGAQEVAIGKLHLQELHPSLDSAFVQSGIQCQVEGQQDSCSRTSKMEVCDEETRNIRDYSGPISNCNAVYTNISIETRISADCEIMVDKQQKDTGYGFSSGLETSDITRSVTDMEFSTINNRTSPTEEPHAMEDLSVYHNDLSSTVSETCCESTGAADVGGHPEISGATLSCNHHDVSNDKRKGFENTNSRNAEFPSFDLGID
ncbi:protein of unknown function DUF2439 [Cynara cardunculus var. scolymus]|uniref:5'-3' DNA helicase ZGRF1-like N-terminal domain-containing protein n=1 Tax=Cynara cardunculus var. scolymus TaxID=59895 RepID=A0A124SBV0_CYNCS|nr:protein of unknown function DUF2439 [Cynara cardunculus var. scolymus]